MHLMVAASEVRPGDYLYNNLATHPVFRWIRVWRSGIWLGDPNRIQIETSAWYTIKHAREGVFIRRTT